MSNVVNIDGHDVRVTPVRELGGVRRAHATAYLVAINLLSENIDLQDDSPGPLIDLAFGLVEVCNEEGFTRDDIKMLDLPHVMELFLAAVDSDAEGVER